MFFVEAKKWVDNFHTTISSTHVNRLKDAEVWARENGLRQEGRQRGGVTLYATMGDEEYSLGCWGWTDCDGFLAPEEIL